MRFALKSGMWSSGKGMDYVVIKTHWVIFLSEGLIHCLQTAKALGTQTDVSEPLLKKQTSMHLTCNSLNCIYLSSAIPKTIQVQC